MNENRWVALIPDGEARHGMSKPGMPFTLPSYDADTTPIAGPTPGFSRIAPREESNGKLVRV